MKSRSVFPDTTKDSDFHWENPDFSRTQGVCHVTYVLFVSSLGKV